MLHKSGIGVEYLSTEPVNYSMSVRSKLIVLCHNNVKGHDSIDFY